MKLYIKFVRLSFGLGQNVVILFFQLKYIHDSGLPRNWNPGKTLSLAIQAKKTWNLRNFEKNLEF